jgi:hypothetical protein
MGNAFLKLANSFFCRSQAGENIQVMHQGATAESGTKYRCLDIARIPLTRGSELVYAPFNHAAQILPQELARLLSSCQDFHSLDEHACCLHSKFISRYETRDLLRDQLSQFVQQQLLVSEHSILDGLKGGQVSRPNHKITFLGIPTRDRTAQMTRAATSYIQHFLKYGRSINLLISDDSGQANVRQANRNALKKIGKLYGLQILYAGLEEKLRFAKLLSKKLNVADNLIEGAFLRDKRFATSYGACRNALVLHSAGDLIFQADDDTICKAANPPSHSNGLALSSQPDPTEHWFFRDSKHLVGSVPFVDTDLLATHEQALGHSIAAIIADFPERSIDTRHLSSSFLRRARHPDSRVVATFGGMMGDSGTEHIHGYFFLRPSSSERLLQSEETFRGAVESRQILRAANCLTICEGTFCVANNMALDNRTVLPPYSPIQRNEDTVFAALVAACMPGSYFGTPAVALLHSPPNSRRASVEALFGDVGSFRVNDLLSVLLSGLGPSLIQLPSEDRLPALGKELKSIGSMLPSDFQEFLRILLWKMISKKLAVLELKLEHAHGQGDWWTKYLKRYLILMQSAAASTTLAIPADLMCEMGPETASAAFQQFIVNFGCLLEVWPTIWNEARCLREGGQPLAVAA